MMTSDVPIHNILHYNSVVTVQILTAGVPMMMMSLFNAVSLLP